MSLTDFDKLILSDVVPKFDRGAGKILGVGTVNGERRVIIQNFNNEYRYVNGKHDILPLSMEDFHDLAVVEQHDLEHIGKILQSKSSNSNFYNQSSHNPNQFGMNNSMNNSMGMFKGKTGVIDPNLHSVGVNKPVLMILTFFFGAFGLHLFMMKKIGMGILYFFLCWTGLSTLFAIIDVIKIAMLTDAEYAQKYNYGAE